MTQHVQPRILNLKGSNVLSRNLQANTRFIINQGGSRSSKTYSILQKYVVRAHEFTGKVFTISRKTLPALRATAMRDFFEILRNAELYSEADHNKSDNTYQLNGNLFEFISADNPQKIRGRKRNYLLMNECNEFDYEDFKQFVLRTTDEITLDFNPSEGDGFWLYDHVLTRDDVTFIKSNFLDNPFLEPSLVEEIKRLKDVSPIDWLVFGLGERGYSTESIYTNWKITDTIPPGAGDQFFGLDFGFNNSTALVQLYVYDGEYYVDELIYQTKLTNSDLIQLMVRLPDIKKYPIYADAAEPQRIEELNRAGFKVHSADKSVTDGIDKVKRSVIHVTKQSVNIMKERAAYKWMKDKNGRILDAPVKFMDHAMDAIRYGIHSYTKTTNQAKTYITKW